MAVMLVSGNAGSIECARAEMEHVGLSSGQNATRRTDYLSLVSMESDAVDSASPGFFVHGQIVKLGESSAITSIQWQARL
jgi:hypothetical protein